jgi:hypothetical protein
MSSYVGPIIIGGFLQEKEVIPEKFGGQHMSSAANSNISFEYGKPNAYSS